MSACDVCRLHYRHHTQRHYTYMENAAEWRGNLIHLHKIQSAGFPVWYLCVGNTKACTGQCNSSTKETLIPNHKLIGSNS